MTETIILAFSAFFIALLGTRWVIFTLKKRAVSPDIDILMGRKNPPPFADAGIALTFALIIGLLGADAPFIIVFPMFLLAGMALLAGIVQLPNAVKYAVYIAVIVVGLTVFDFSASQKIIAAIFWLLVIASFSCLKNTENYLPIIMIIIAICIAAMEIWAERFPSALATQSLVFSGSGFGFFWWNTKPAKVFAGEIGAIPVGFVAGYLLLMMLALL